MLIKLKKPATIAGTDYKNGARVRCLPSDGRRAVAAGDAAEVESGSPDEALAAENAELQEAVANLTDELDAANAAKEALEKANAALEAAAKKAG